VCLGIETPKALLSVYVTKNGKVRIHDQRTGREFLPATPMHPGVSPGMRKC
jgi:hypothetical protein